MISDEFNNFLANPESPLFVAGDLVGLAKLAGCLIGLLLKLAGLSG
jgi:hypothetical protein